MGLGDQRHASVVLPPGNKPNTSYTGGLVGRAGRVQKISPPPEFDPRTFQPVMNRYTMRRIPTCV
jgi:hypothetical protein